MPATPESGSRHFSTLLVLILAGEVIFSLPFHIPRFFRPTLLDVFEMSNTQLGDIFAVYGLVALLAYFPGGTIADRFSARKLISLSLAATALGGFYLYTLPPLAGLYLVFAYWGLTTILLFWAALIKATRDWGGERKQGLAFGVLDGGRGFVASLFATIAVFVLGQRLASTGSDQAAMQSVIMFYSCVSLLSAAVVWLVLPHKPQAKPEMSARAPALERPHWRRVIAQPSVWLQAGIVICAYCGYKSLDNYGVYAVEVLGMSTLEAAQLTTYASYTRPLAAVAAGLLADRWRPSRMIMMLFACAGVAFFAMSAGAGPASGLLLANLVLTFVAVYALRGIYFSLIEEAKVDRQITGSAVGLISLLGFTPDIFFAALTGRLLDANPGALGFQHYFLVMTVLSIAGMLFTLALSRRFASKPAQAGPVS